MKPPGIFKKRIPALVWSGIALLLVLGLATSLFLLLRLRSTIRESEAFAAATEQVRAAVRDLYADYIDQELNRVLLSPQAGAEMAEPHARMRASDDHGSRLLRRALAATHSEALRRVLTELQEHDRAVASPLAEEVVALARTDLVAARALYLTRYLPAQARNLELVKDAKRLAAEEVAALATRSQAEAARAQFWSRLAIAGFIGLGITAAYLLARAVAAVVRQVAGAESALLESQRFLRSTLDALSSHIAILDEQGTIIEVNAAWNRYGRENDSKEGGHRSVGTNYLQVCDSVSGYSDLNHPANTVNTVPGAAVTGLSQAEGGQLSGRGTG